MMKNKKTVKRILVGLLVGVMFFLLIKYFSKSTATTTAQNTIVFDNADNPTPPVVDPVISPQKTDKPVILLVKPSSIQYTGVTVGSILMLFENNVLVLQGVATGNIWAGLALNVGSYYSIIAKYADKLNSEVSGQIICTDSTPVVDVVTGTNEIADISFSTPVHLNEIDLRFLTDFDVPLHPNPKFQDQRVFECMITGPFWMQQTGVGNIFKKGVTSVDFRMLRGGAEYQGVPYNQNFRSPVDIRKISFNDYCQNYDRLNLGTEDDANAFNSVDYSHYSDITNNFKYNVPQFFDGQASPLFQGRIVISDIENGSINLKNSNRQAYVNRMVAITQAYLDGVGQNTLVSHMYQSLPKQDVGFGITKAMYSEAADSSWTMTANETGQNFPANLRGKSLATLDNRFASCFEYYPPYETYLDEDVQLYNMNNEPLKDYNGNLLPKLSHFGTIQINRALPNFKHTQLHWAAHAAAGLGINRRLLPREKFLILQANNWNMEYYYNNYYGQPAHATIKQINDGNERYPMPNYMIQGMICISLFSNSIYQHWDSPISVGNYADRSQGEYRGIYPDPTPARIDYKTVSAQQAMIKRISTGGVSVNGNTHTLSEIIDGTETYLLENIVVNYLTVTGFTTPKKIYPTDWMEHELSPVMAIVNVSKRLIAIWGTIAYNGSNEPREVEVHYTENGFNFVQRITLQPNKSSIFIYSLDRPVSN